MTYGRAQEIPTLTIFGDVTVLCPKVMRDLYVDECKEFCKHFEKTDKHFVYCRYRCWEPL